MIKSNKISNFFKSSYLKAAELAEDGAAGVSSQVDRLRDKRFCIGITGLSQSGKSTFITSLINQLVNHETANLPGFSPVLGERLLGVKIHTLEDRDLAAFPYDESYSRLASPDPQWPQSTEDASGCLLELILENTGFQLNPLSSNRYSLYLEIRDYPGEWLLDLPLREMSYSRWCAQCSAQYTQSPRKELLGDFLDELQQIDPLSEVETGRLQLLNSRYINFLNVCKHGDKSLSLIQPGRFLIPGNVADTEVLCFIPLLNVGRYTEGQLSTASDNSYYKACERRYQRYIKELVDPFYKKFFSRINRQLVLVDVVSALNAGQEYVDDMRQALSSITDSFSYGQQSLFFKLFNPKIDKVVFAATKIDQVLSEDHESVRQLLSVLIKQAYRNAQHEGVIPVCEATASVRSSLEIEHQGERGISGLNQNGDPVGYIHPRIPLRIPEGDEWRPFVEWEIPRVNPPLGLSSQNEDAIPHIRMDTMLNLLIGDKCL
ncbi:YcjX family protein [Pseudomonadales bacterium]|nr:YcjX family protein [Pseudomonadales bacterium]